jgi:hypothetical protein
VDKTLPFFAGFLRVLVLDLWLEKKPARRLRLTAHKKRACYIVCDTYIALPKSSLSRKSESYPHTYASLKGY